MSLAGTGVVAIWNDIAPEGRADFYEWHDREHIPERVGIPGFLRGRRYIAVHGTPQYFTLYEADTPETLSGKDYFARLNDPTPWTAKVVPANFRNVSRGVCRVALSDGVAQGGYMLTLRHAPQAGRHGDLWQFLKTTLPSLLDRPGIVGVHFCVADKTVSDVETAERKGRQVDIPNWLVMIESVAPESADAACKPLVSDMAANGADPTMNMGLYAFQISRAKTAASVG
jgi:hypothetical protein